MTSLSQPPSQTQKIVDSTGNLTIPWYRWFYTVAQQAWVGGGGGNGGAASAVPVGTSPFDYTASLAGTIILSGGGITALEMSRDGATYIEIGAFRAPVPMSAGDILRVTWTQTAPAMTFFPR